MPRTDTLKVILPRAHRLGFTDYLTEVFEPGEAIAFEDELDALHDWLHDEHTIDVREDGLVEFWELTDEVRTLIGDLPVVLFHHTATGVEDAIRREGLVANPRVRAWEDVIGASNTGAGVYLTTNSSSYDPPGKGYVYRAQMAHGGEPLTLSVVTRLADLELDPDDIDILSGKFQFVVPYVPPKDILEFREPTVGGIASQLPDPLRWWYEEDAEEDQYGPWTQ